MLVYLFGAYAYGAATVYGAREMSPIWGGSSAAYAPRVRRRIDRAGLALFAISTIWFVLHLLLEFRAFTGRTRPGWLDLLQFIVFMFPPVIMHTVYLESLRDDEPAPPAVYRVLLLGMYILGPLMALWMTAAVFDLAWYPPPFGRRGSEGAVTVTRRIGYINSPSGISGEPPYTYQAAAGIVAVLPVIVLVFLFHRRIRSGLTEGYIKG